MKEIIAQKEKVLAKMKEKGDRRVHDSVAQKHFERVPHPSGTLSN
jgi:hypothetical protein